MFDMYTKGLGVSVVDCCLYDIRQAVTSW